MPTLESGDTRPDLGREVGAARDARPAGPDRPRIGGVTPAMVVVAATIVGVLIRLWIISGTALVALNGDEAVTGVMVQRILAGSDHYVFYAGQHYNGALEQYLQAAMYWVLRLPQNAFTLRLPQIALMATATWLMYVVGCRVLHRPWAAALAAVLFAVGPYWTVRQGVGTFGSYPDLIVVGLVAIYCALRLGESGRRGWSFAAGFGFCVGLVGWLGLSGVELLIPAGLLAAPHFLRSRRLWVTAVPAAVLGMSPLLLWSVRNSVFALRNAGPAVQPSTFAGRARGLFGPVLREFIGVGYGFGAPGWPRIWQYLAVAALAVAFVVAVVRRRAGIRAVLTLRRDGSAPLDALLVSIPIMALLYCSSKWAWYTAQPRYLFAFSPVLLWCLAAALPARPRPFRVVAVLVGVVIFAATSLTMLARQSAGPARRHNADLVAVVAYLKASDQHDGYAQYFTAMPLLYTADGSVDIAAMDVGKRFAQVQAAVDAAPAVFYVSGAPDSTARAGGRFMENAMARHHIAFHRVRIGSFVVYDHLTPESKPWQLGIGTPPSRRAP